jgi:hypothetical protein
MIYQRMAIRLLAFALMFAAASIASGNQEKFSDVIERPA